MCFACCFSSLSLGVPTCLGSNTSICSQKSRISLTPNSTPIDIRTNAFAMQTLPQNRATHYRRASQRNVCYLMFYEQNIQARRNSLKNNKPRIIYDIPLSSDDACRELNGPLYFPLPQSRIPYQEPDPDQICSLDEVITVPLFNVQPDNPQSSAPNLAQHNLKSQTVTPSCMDYSPTLTRTHSDAAEGPEGFLATPSDTAQGPEAEPMTPSRLDLDQALPEISNS